MLKINFLCVSDKISICLMIELYELAKITTPQKKGNVYPGFLKQNQIIRPSKITELSMEKTHHHVFQFVYGTRNLWRMWRLSLHWESKPFSVPPACDANPNSNVKLLDQHHKLAEQNKVVMLILFNQLEIANHATLRCCWHLHHKLVEQVIFMRFCLRSSHFMGVHITQSLNT